MELFLFHFRQTGYTLKQVFLMTPAYGTVDPANLEAILSTKFHGTEDVISVTMISPRGNILILLVDLDFNNGPRRDCTLPMFGDGIFTQDGDAWKHSREILRPQLFHRKYETLEIFEESVDSLLDALPQAGDVVDLQPLFFRLTLDVTAAFLFGESTKTLQSHDLSGKDSFASSFDVAQAYVAKRFRLLDLYWLIGGRQFRQACEKVHRFADEIIDRNLALKSSKNTNENFLRSVNRQVADRAALRGQIVNILVAGRDTTACLLSWTL